MYSVSFLWRYITDELDTFAAFTDVGACAAGNFEDLGIRAARASGETLNVQAMARLPLRPLYIAALFIHPCSSRYFSLLANCIAFMPFNPFIGFN